MAKTNNPSLRRIVERLNHSEERFRLLVESVQDYALFMLYPAGRIASWNHGAERIKGYRAGEVVGRHFSLFYTRDDIDCGKPDAALEKAAASGRFEDEGWRVRKGGSLFWAGDEYAGGGLGLITAKRIIECHGGRIWAEARPGAGASFFVSLPLAAPETLRPSRGEPAGKPAA